MEEKWIITELVNTDYPNRKYCVSDLGRVKSIENGEEVIRFDPANSSSTERKGYKVHVQRRPIRVRKLVYHSFNKIPLEDRIPLESKDGNIFNVRLDNIRDKSNKSRMQQDSKIDLGCKEARVKFRIGCKDDKIPCDYEYWVEIDFISEKFPSKIYYISDMGRIASYDKDTENYKIEVDTYNQKRKLSHNGDGYYSWTVNKVTYNIHRLVASYFYHTPITSGLMVHHKNGIKTDNRACNLEWVSYEEHGKAHMEHEVVGNKIRENNKKNRKYSWDTVCKIRKMYEEDKMTKHEISQVVGIDFGTIRQIVNYDTYKTE